MRWAPPKAYIYVRAEYPLAIKRLKIAIRQAEKLGLLGIQICGTRFSFRIELRLGAGAFVCGEETALIASIEGKRGTPRPRPPYPAMEGLLGQPTLINNVETFANIPPIIRHGGDWYAAIGTEKSKGTKVFALAGRVQNTGLVEVPMGITLREMVFEIGGGIPDGRKFKAVQTGGPSGGCMPAEFLDMPVDYESLAKSRLDHGLRRNDRDGRKFLHGRCREVLHGFLHDRILRQMHSLPRGHLPDASHCWTRITDSKPRRRISALLEELCDLVKNTSLCGLGQSAPNPVLSTLRYFADEYKAHIERNQCPAGVCGQHGARPGGDDRMSPPRRQNAEDRRPGLQRPRRRDHPRRGPPEQYLHSHVSANWRVCRRSAPAACASSKSRAPTAAACLRDRVEEGMEVTTDSERLQKLPQA